MEHIEEEILKNFYNYFPEFNFLNLKGDSYIIGGFISSILFNEDINDLDIVVLNGNYDNIKENLDLNNLTYTTNFFGGFRIKDSYREIDIYLVSNFINAYEYNIEGLFLDIKRKIFVDVTFSKALKRKSLMIVNENNRGKNEDVRCLKPQKRLDNYLKLYNKKDL